MPVTRSHKRKRLALQETTDPSSQSSNIRILDDINKTIERITSELNETKITDKNLAFYLFEKIPNHLLFDKILSKLTIRDIFQFGQALLLDNENENYRKIFLNWLFSNATRKMIHRKMTSVRIIDFLIDFQIDVQDVGDRLFCLCECGDCREIRKEIYGHSFFQGNFAAEADNRSKNPFTLNYLSGLFLDQLFNEQTRVTDLELNRENTCNSSTDPELSEPDRRGIWIKMPGQLPKNEISWTQKIIAKFLSQAPRKIAFIWIRELNLILPDFYDEPIKNDPDNYDLYEYLMEWKFNTMNGLRRASIVSALLVHIIRYCCYYNFGMMYEVKIRLFAFDNKKCKLLITEKSNRIFTRIYMPRSKSTRKNSKSFLNCLRIAFRLSIQDRRKYEFSEYLRDSDYNYPSTIEQNWAALSNSPSQDQKQIIRNGLVEDLLDLVNSIKNVGHLEVYGLANTALGYEAYDPFHKVYESLEMHLDQEWFHILTGNVAAEDHVDIRCDSTGVKSYLKMSAFDCYYNKIIDRVPCKYNSKIRDVILTDKLYSGSAEIEFRYFNHYLRGEDCAMNENAPGHDNWLMLFNQRDYGFGPRGLSWLSLLDIDIDNIVINRIMINRGPSMHKSLREYPPAPDPDIFRNDFNKIKIIERMYDGNKLDLHQSPWGSFFGLDLPTENFEYDRNFECTLDVWKTYDNIRGVCWDLQTSNDISDL